MYTPGSVLVCLVRDETSEAAGTGSSDGLVLLCHQVILPPAIKCISQYQPQVSLSCTGDFTELRILREGVALHTQAPSGHTDATTHARMHADELALEAYCGL